MMPRSVTVLFRVGVLSCKPERGPGGDQAGLGSQLALLPQLKRLLIYARTSFSSSTLLAFLQAKRMENPHGSVSRLRQLKLVEVTQGYLCGSKLLRKKDIEQKMKALKADGLDVVVEQIHQVEAEDLL
jgi:hypothetical protein